MSKNVAVFVDVANIFYAAKAAGVDIDYVTLLKAATAGRDFVRAYAYTGLDPENDNQRQFHAFLARNGYKVISKDIRKYGDGRIKANLDIELVVDMMKTARNLDIAVVVSGDGDFASAIRAVQEMGVRVEVISFRGNTSSDLIDVADLFTDIAQIARVDKSSTRSGRRVAEDDDEDLSMTEVPEKETEGAPRRRRGGRPVREERPAAVVEHVDPEHGANIVVLPGERLSRAGETDGELAEETDEEAAYAAASNGTEPEGEEARRRRRRRGGRGRGRGGRRPEDEGLAATGEPAVFADEEEEFEELPTAQPPVHAFGSVWDNQLGMPTSASMPPTVDLGGGDVDAEEDFDEPEVPEYLLAERRQRGQRPPARGRSGGTGGRGRGAYQAALDRERYGSRSPQPTFGTGSGNTGGGNRAPSNPNRDRSRQGSRPPQGSRPIQDRGPRPPRTDYAEPRSSSSEPWSEVPPELEQMLRAELARKQPVTESVPTSSFEEIVETGEAPAKPARKPRTTTKKSTAASEAVAAQESPAPAKKPTRARATKAATTKAASDAPAEPAAETPAAEPKKTTTRRRTTKSAPAAEEG